MEIYRKIPRSKVLELKEGDELYYTEFDGDEYHTCFVKYSTVYQCLGLHSNNGSIVVSFDTLKEDREFYRKYSFYISRIEYSAEEILHKIQNKELQGDDILIDKNGIEDSVFDILEQDVSALIEYAPYTIKEKPVTLTFDEILNSKYNFKQMKIYHKILNDYNTYNNYDYFSSILHHLTSTFNDMAVKKIIKEAKFEIKEN